MSVAAGSSVPDERTGRVLVTGAAGFLGRHVLPLLTAAGRFEVHAVSRTPRHGDGVSWHTADLLEKGSAGTLVRTIQPTHVLHLAWYTEHGRYWSSAANLAWTASTLDLIEAFAMSGGRRAVLAGTCAEYDLHGAVGPCREDTTPERPSSLYGASKLAVARVAHAYAATAGFELAWGRVFYIYGPGESPSRLIPSVVRSLLQDERAMCLRGNHLRDYLFVRDAASALVSLLESGLTGAVNVASGRAVSLGDLVRLIGSRVGKPGLVDVGTTTDTGAEPASVVADVGRLSTEVGWLPSYSLTEGLDETIAWWRSLDVDERAIR